VALHELVKAEVSSPAVSLVKVPCSSVGCTDFSRRPLTECQQPWKSCCNPAELHVPLDSKNDSRHTLRPWLHVK